MNLLVKTKQVHAVSKFEVANTAKILRNFHLKYQRFCTKDSITMVFLLDRTNIDKLVFCKGQKFTYPIFRGKICAMRIELHTYLRSPTVLVQTGRLDVGTILSLTFCRGEYLGALIVMRPLGELAVLDWPAISWKSG